MRELKFRAWHNDANEYCEGSISNMFGWVESGQDVALEQFTELKDMDGCAIYEGDIVNIFYIRGGFNHDGNYIASITPSGVEFKFISLPWSCHGHNQYPFHSTLLFSSYGILRGDYRNFCEQGRICISEMDDFEYSNYIKIIGNIHQNNELLK